jgi:hypothetical protein
LQAGRHHIPDEELQSLGRRKSCPAARRCHTPPGCHSPPPSPEEEDASSEDEGVKRLPGSVSSCSLVSGELYCSARPETTYYR